MGGREGGYVVPVDPPDGLKKKGAGSRSWILMHSSGQGIILDVDKYAIMHRVQIHARDLRILDPLLSYPSTILGREKAIVLNLEHIKAIITAEEVLICDPCDDNVTPVIEELRRRLKPVSANREELGDRKDFLQHDAEMGEEDDSPFELRALEVALEAICSFLSARTIELETAVYPALDMLMSKISSRNLDRVRKLKSQMTRLTARVQKVRDELEQLLDDDDDMADLYLSRKLIGATPVSGSGAASWFLASPTIGSKVSKASRASIATIRGDENDVEELEMLLEAYFMQIDGTLNKLTTLREYIDNTEDYINIQLDNHRNQLIQLFSIGDTWQIMSKFPGHGCHTSERLWMPRGVYPFIVGSSLRFIYLLFIMWLQLELFLNSGTVCLSIYSLISGIFGMNIPFTWNDNHGYVFKWVVILSGAISAIVFVLIVSYARRKGLVGS